MEIKGEIVALDASFIEKYSKRDPHNGSRRYSDHEARVGRSRNDFTLESSIHSYYYLKYFMSNRECIGIKSAPKK